MGLYEIKCPSCGVPTMWYSGNINQLCAQCNLATSGQLPNVPKIQTINSMEWSQQVIVANSQTDEDYEELRRFRSEAKLPRICGEHIALGYGGQQCLLDSKHCEKCVEERNHIKSSLKGA